MLFRSHVLQHSNGDGFLDAQTIQDQVDVLNEDFQAIAGTPGGPGHNAKIRFRLASLDPEGNPTTGITYTTNDQWFNDQGNYGDSLTWDSNRYVNIFTNEAGGYYGYVNGFASMGDYVGTPDDYVVINWQTVGRVGTPWWPGNLGRTGTHEIGHYVGLWHTFEGGCADSDCYADGDQICDTEPEASSASNCDSQQSSCGSPDPIHNYMDYTTDVCLWEFTPEQVNRARCTLQNWRPDVYAVVPPGRVDQLLAAKVGVDDIAWSWDADPSAAYYRVYTTENADDPGRGDNPAATLRCEATNGATSCRHTGGQSALPDLLFYQAVGDCDTDASDEGPN